MGEGDLLEMGFPMPPISDSKNPSLAVRSPLNDSVVICHPIVTIF